MLDKIRAIRRVIVHKCCSDGTLAGAIIKQALPHVVVEECQYSTPEHEHLSAEPGLCFADFSPPASRVQEFVNAGAVVLDHHKGAEAIVRQFGDLGFFGDEVKMPGVSGAVLAYDHIYVPICGQDEALQDFARLIGIRDTFQTGHPRWNEACQISAAVWSLPLGYWLSQKPVINDLVKLMGNTQIKRREAQVTNAYDQLEVIRLPGPPWSPSFGIFADSKSCISDVAELARRKRLCENVLGFHFVKDGPKEPLKLMVSCRSDGRLDSAMLAKYFGGGGHTKAAGFSLPYNPWDSPSPFQVIQERIKEFWNETVRKRALEGH